VDVELFNLIRRSLKISELTEGAFDISYASMDQLWYFDGSMKVPPSDEEIKASVANVGFENILLNEKNHSVYLDKKGMKIGFGAIGKGYAANRAKMILTANGFNNGMVNAGGDLIAWGEGFNNEKWKIGIADPKKETEYISWLEIKDQAIVTSGDYEKYVAFNGVRYAHIINPKTGYPTTGIKSVSIICPDAELADAIATSVFVLGKENGLKLVNEMNLIECIIVDNNDEFSTSEGIDLTIITNP